LRNALKNKSAQNEEVKCRTTLAAAALALPAERQLAQVLLAALALWEAQPLEQPLAQELPVKRALRKEREPCRPAVSALPLERTAARRALPELQALATSGASLSSRGGWAARAYR
jgi:hypothetical protein